MPSMGAMCCCCPSSTSQAAWHAARTPGLKCSATCLPSKPVLPPRWPTPPPPLPQAHLGRGPCSCHHSASMPSAGHMQHCCISAYRCGCSGVWQNSVNAKQHVSAPLQSCACTAMLLLVVCMCMSKHVPVQLVPVQMVSHGE